MDKYIISFSSQIKCKMRTVSTFYKVDTVLIFIYKASINSSIFT
ncbi:hypothetical protein FM106_32100 [Brachybacterium faecium]|nr:hypothetical protein FM106_32100 [Brachybacterium faecium]